MKPSPHRAFSLLELLATMSVVVILASLLFPTVRNAQTSAKSAACLNNLKNIGTAFHLYAADNNGLLPAMRYRASSVGTNPNPGLNNWQFEINPYLEINGTTFKTVVQKSPGRAVFCPEYLRDFQTNTDIQSYKAGGYGMAKLSSDAYDNRTPLASIQKPALTILAGDSDDYHLSITSATWRQAGEDGRYSSGDPVRHGKTANYLFVDGHVSAQTLDQAQAILTGTEETP